MNTSMKNRRSGFTLVELLVVMSMIVVLADVFKNRLTKAPAFRMPDKTNLSKMFLSDLSEVREAWVTSNQDAAVQIERRRSDFLAAENHRAKKRCSTPPGTVTGPRWRWPVSRKQ